MLSVKTWIVAGGTIDKERSKCEVKFFHCYFEEVGPQKQPKYGVYLQKK